MVQTNQLLFFLFCLSLVHYVYDCMGLDQPFLFSPFHFSIGYAHSQLLMLDLLKTHVHLASHQCADYAHTSYVGAGEVHLKLILQNINFGLHINGLITR